MLRQLQIGCVHFVFNLPATYQWGAKDLRFRAETPQPNSRLVEVIVERSETLDEPQDAPVFRSESLSVWAYKDMEIRSYRALFLPGYPLYAISKCCDNRVNIQFDFSTGAWSHPNMLLWALVHLENLLLEADSILLHSCYTQYQGKAILFTAPSGTGKTTQANIWRRVYGSEIVNGDITLLQQSLQGWEACGFPISGSAEECENENYPIGAIVIVRQAQNNWIEPLSPLRQVQLLYSECFVNTWNKARINRVFNLIEDLVAKVPVLLLHCNMGDEAAHVLYDYLKL